MVTRIMLQLLVSVNFPGDNSSWSLNYLQCGRRRGLRVMSARRNAGDACHLDLVVSWRATTGQETQGGVDAHRRVIFVAVLPSANEQGLVAFRIPPRARQLLRYGRVNRQGTVGSGQLSILKIFFEYFILFLKEVP